MWLRGRWKCWTWKWLTWNWRTNLQGMKLQDVKMMDQMTGHEIAGHEIARHKRTGYQTSSEAANIWGWIDSVDLTFQWQFPTTDNTEHFMSYNVVQHRQTIIISCPAVIFMSCIFMSSNFMSCKLVCHFHILQFHTLHMVHQFRVLQFWWSMIFSQPLITERECPSATWWDGVKVGWC